MTVDNERVQELVDQLRDFLEEKDWTISAESLMALLTVAGEVVLVQSNTPMPKAVFLKQADLCFEMVKKHHANETDQGLH